MSRVPVRIAADAAAAPVGWAVLRQGACPCCVGKVQLQVDLVRLVREDRPPGVFIELLDRLHAQTLRRSLREWPFSDYLVVMPD
jgi:hypothetical protein